MMRWALRAIGALILSATAFATSSVNGASLWSSLQAVQPAVVAGFSPTVFTHVQIMNLPVVIEDVDGDKSIPGVFYYGTSSGVFCGSPSPSYCNGSTWLLKRDLDPEANDSPMWLDEVA